MTKEKKTPEGGIKVVAVNRKARFNYHIIETLEAGLVLSGAEIKSIRETGISLEQAYITPLAGGLFLLGAHIKPYSHGTPADYDPVRKRKLLMHKHEIDKFAVRAQAKGYTIVPLQLHLKRGRAKLEIALAKGKDAPDKRKTIRDREADRELARVVKARK